MINHIKETLLTKLMKIKFLTLWLSTTEKQLERITIRRRMKGIKFQNEAAFDDQE